jgi:hypothetical protein
MSDIVWLTGRSEIEHVPLTGALRLLRFDRGGQRIERLQQEFWSSIKGRYWLDVPVIPIKTPDENPA